MDAVVAKRPTFRRRKVGYRDWVIMGSGPFGHYEIVFAGGGRLRAEVYIDMTDPPDGAKRVFDAVREELEFSVEEAFRSDDVRWERLDRRRASRIAVYGAVPDLSNDTSTSIAVEWAADRLLRLMQFDDELRRIAASIKE